MEREGDRVIAVEDMELAFARLDWACAATSARQPGQEDALSWHRAACDDALAALPAQPSNRTDADDHDEPEE